MNKDLLLALIGEERSIEERLRALEDLRDFLGDREIALALASLYPNEKSIRVRRALLDAAVGCPETTPALVEFFYTVIAREPEAELRLAALRRVAQFGGSEELLVECLRNDLNEAIQAECLKGLARAGRPGEKTMTALHEFAPHAPAALKPILLDLFEGDGVGLSELLDPADPPELKLVVLEKISRLPAPPARPLTEFVRREPSRDLRLRALGILMQRTDADPEPALEEPELVKDRIGSIPGLSDRLASAFKTARSTRLKLALLEGLDRLDVCLQALADPSPAVRRVGVEGALRRVHRDAGAVARALIEAIPREPLGSLREAMIRGLYALPEAEGFLIAWFERETDPRAERALAAALLRVAVTEENRAALLRIYLRILQEPLFDPAARDEILEKLSAYAHRNEPELKRALVGLLERAPDLDLAERVDRLLRIVEPDPSRLIEPRLRAFYRFAGRYPIDPLVEWLREFRSLAAQSPDVKRQIPWLAAVTGADWILDAADSPASSEAGARILEWIRRGSIRGARETLREAYGTRALKKKDLIELLRNQLNHRLAPHNSHPLLDDVLKIMADVKLAPPEAVDLCFDHLRDFPGGTAEHSLRTYLDRTGPHEDRLEAEFTAEGYRRFCRTDADARDPTRRPSSWGDSDHWRAWHTQWTLGDMARESLKEWRALAHRGIQEPIDPRTPCQQSFHYYLLHQLWRSPERSVGERTAIGRLMRAVRTIQGYELLFDRALFLFCDRWSETTGATTPEFAQLAAEAFVEQLRRHRENAAGLPQLLPGMDVDHLRRVWPWDESEWARLWEGYRACLTGARPGAGPGRGPILYNPIQNPQSEMIDFLIETEPGSSVPIWRDLLSAARAHCPRMLDHRLERASPERRAALSAWLGR
jgi:hypothetical protein